jgi:Fe-S oxidoreductase
MWFDEPQSERVSNLRAQETIATGAQALATACPFCLNMMTDGMAGVAGGHGALTTRRSSRLSPRLL